MNEQQEKVQKEKILIVGAGASGLTLALELTKLNIFDIQVIDQKPRIGGMIKKGESKDHPSLFFETAANGVMLKEPVVRFLTEHEIDFKLNSKKSNKRFIIRNQKAHQWPLRFFETLSFILAILWNVFIFKKHKKYLKKNLSVKEWAQKIFPTSFIHQVLSPALQGIYAGRIEKLSASLVFNPFFQKKRRQKLKGLVSGHDSTWDLLNSIYAKLLKKSVQFQLGVSFNESLKMIHEYHIQKFPVVIATSAPEAHLIFKSLNWIDNLTFLNQIEMISVVTTTSFFKTETQPIDSAQEGFGYLVPQSENQKVLGLLMNNIIYDRKTPEIHSETWIWNAQDYPELLNWTEKEFSLEVQKLRHLWFQKNIVPFFTAVTKWPKGLPYYTTELKENLEQNYRENLSCLLHGNYLGAIGLTKIIERSQDIAKKYENWNHRK